ncbi:hypothetical protein GA0115246_113041, partial [Streptomyces sp. SolWspMP-sol7th]
TPRATGPLGGAPAVPARETATPDRESRSSC